jgi:hypothetical protein
MGGRLAGPRCPLNTMLYQHLIDATGLIALTLNVSGLVRRDDRAMMRTGAWASAVWALNNLLIGAQTAAVLSALGAGRQAGASALRGRGDRPRAWAFAGIAGATVLLAVLTWSGALTAALLAGSLLASFAMFYLRGAPMRWVMVLVNGLWMVNAVASDAGWQMAASAIAGTAAAVGAWRAGANGSAAGSALALECCGCAAC